jgi:ketosteroid isomerase-like protein
MGAGEPDLPLDRVAVVWLHRPARRDPRRRVSGDLAYTVELEHTSVSIDGVPVEPYTLRVTQVYRREDGEWKVVHRHGDQLSIDQSQRLPGEASTA